MLGEWRWKKRHIKLCKELAGEWVAIKGGNLILHSVRLQEVLNGVQAVKCPSFFWLPR